MTNKRLFLILLTILWILYFLVMLTVGPVDAQTPDKEGSDQSLAQDRTATPSSPPKGKTDLRVLFLPVLLTTRSAAQNPSPPAGMEITGTGIEVMRSAASDVSALALPPVDCAVLNPPVVGFEISKGQDSNDIADFINDLLANGFSVGGVDISGGVNPPACVDVLIVYGLAANRSLSAPYTAAEGALLQAWAAGGHGLMLSGDWGIFRTGTDALFQTYGYSQQGPNPVTDPTNFDSPAPPPPNAWVIYQADNFTSHPILNGVASLELLASSWLSSAANAIVTADTDAIPSNAPVMAAFVDGSGCVALSTDSNWLGVAGGGYFKQDNARVARQMIEWLNGCTSLKLTKTAGPNPVEAGGLLTYTLTAINDSVIAVTNVLITDTIPANTSFVTATLPHTGPDANSVVTWPLGTLNPNTSATVVMVVRVNNTVPTGTLIANTAWVTSSQGLTDTASTLTTVNARIVDPLITKAANPGQVQVGDVVTFTLTVRQTAQSTSNATNVQIVDQLPDEVDILSVEVDAGFTVVTGRVITWTIPVLTPADTRLMTIATIVNNSATPPLTITNQATLRFDQGTDRLSNQVEIFVTAMPTLELTKVATPNPVRAGDLLTYTLTARNDSAGLVPDVIITDTVPANTTFVTATLPHIGPDANSVVTWSLGTLNPNSSATVTMVVQVGSSVPTGTVIANTAWVTSSQGLTDTATALTPVVTTEADLSITKSDTPDPVAAGGTLTYTLAVFNAGPSAAVGVVVSDTLPAGVSLNTVSSSQGSCAALPCTLGTLTAGATATITVVGTVDPGVTGILTNTAGVSSGTPDPDPTDNTATTLTSVNVQSVNPVIIKAANPDRARVDEVVTFTLTIRQAGQSTSDATNIRVVDPLPGEVNVLGVEASAGSTTLAGRTVTWTIPLLTPTETQLMTITTRVNHSFTPPRTMTNQASLSFDQGADRLSNLVEVFVPASGSRPTATPHSSQDDDDQTRSTPATPTPAPVAAISAATPVAPVLPVTLLPETGKQTAFWPGAGWLRVGLILLLTIFVIFARRIYSC